MDHEVEKITAELVLKNFDLELVSDLENDLQQIRILLISKLDYLLDHDFERLLQILYRIDVSEKKSNEALRKKSDRKPSELLADLIIERQIEKAKTRIEFSKK